MKNNNINFIKKSCSSAVTIMLMAMLLLLSQLTLAKDRIQYHVQNFDGSTIKVINEQGIVTQSYQYAPFGQQLPLKKPTNLKNPNAFVGGVQDADDLVYLKARHYNPVLGRFYQPDPVTFIMKGHGQTNRYQYGWNDSFSFSDINGNETTAAIGSTPEEIRYYEQLGDQRGYVYNKNDAKADLSAGNIISSFLPFGTAFNLLKESWFVGKVVQGFNFVLPEFKFFTSVDQYALVASRDGFYPIMVRGFKEPQGGIFLKEGEVWKYGTTQNPATRYTQRFLDNTGSGLIYKEMFNGTKQQALLNEKQLILLYRDRFGFLPPGNKMVK